MSYPQNLQQAFRIANTIENEIQKIKLFGSIINNKPMKAYQHQCPNCGVSGEIDSSTGICWACNSQLSSKQEIKRQSLNYFSLILNKIHNQ